MYSKSGEGGKEGPSWRQLSPPWSISVRLALLHITTVFASFLVCAAVLYFVLTHHMESENIKSLKNQAGAIETMLLLPDGRALLRDKLQAQKFESPEETPLIRLLDVQGTMVMESPGMGRVLAAESFPAKSERGTIKRITTHGNLYLMKTFALSGTANQVAGFTLQVAVDCSDDNRFFRIFRWALMVFITCGLLFSLAGAYITVSRGMKPLAEISETARNITEHRLHTRIALEPLPVELVSLAASFNEMLGRLEDSFARLSHYTANLAHELRTPVNNLMIEADIALSRPRTPEEYQKVIGSSMEEFERLSWTIDRLLFLARADCDQNDLIIEKLDVLQEIEEIIEFHSDTSYDQGIEVTYGGDATLSADPVLFRRAVSNLLANAFKYTPRGGRIDVSVRREDDSSVTVSVADTGCGIAPEHLPRIFDRFYRVDAAGRQDPEGSGLGLAIVKAIMTMHGGTVEVESQTGTGTTVKMHFPP
jgi:two-component system, OmpR family, heavy metal sensor histidine kinase CusS